MFSVIPAIDVSGGRLAALGVGGPRPATAYGGDPLAAARAFAEAGATWLHVVDLDLAFHGDARNLDVLSAIAGIGPALQAAGGVRTGDEVRALRDAGATRVVLGSAALGDPDRAAALIASLADAVVAGIEVEDGTIRSRGRDPVELDLMETVGWLVASGVCSFLVTAVDRVGGLGGPDLEVVGRVARAGRPVLAAGGVSRIEHLRDLRAAGAAGAVVGTAALEGTLDVRAAIAEMA